MSLSVEYEILDIKNSILYYVVEAANKTGIQYIDKPIVATENLYGVLISEIELSAYPTVNSLRFSSTFTLSGRVADYDDAFKFYSEILNAFYGDNLLNFNVVVDPIVISQPEDTSGVYFTFSIKVTNN